MKRAHTRFRSIVAISVAASAMSITGCCGLAPNAPSEAGWIDTFLSSPAAYDPLKIPNPLPKELEPFRAQIEHLKPGPPVAGTFRQRLGITVGGRQVRVRFSNEEGTQPLRIEGASIALAGEEMDAVAGTVRRLTFGGKNAVLIPAGAPALSDPVEFQLAAFSELIVSVYLPEPIVLAQLGGSTLTVSPGDQVLKQTLSDAKDVPGRLLVTGISVQPLQPAAVVVALGDSITDGARATPTQAHGWAGVLGHRLALRKDKLPIAVVSAGIGGNRLLRRGLVHPLWRVSTAMFWRSLALAVWCFLRESTISALAALL